MILQSYLDTLYFGHENAERKIKALQKLLQIYEKLWSITKTSTKVWYLRIYAFINGLKDQS